MKTWVRLVLLAAFLIGVFAIGKMTGFTDELTVDGIRASMREAGVGDGVVVHRYSTLDELRALLAIADVGEVTGRMVPGRDMLKTLNIITGSQDLRCLRIDMIRLVFG